MKYDAKTIEEINENETNEVIDLIAVVTFVEEVNEFTAKSTGRHLKKRELTLQDRTGSIQLVLWNEMTETEYEKGMVLLILNGKINEFQNRKNVTVTPVTRIQINPNIENSKISKLLK